MAQAVIASAVRTPIGPFTGAGAGVPATELGAAALRTGGGQGIAMVVERPEGAPEG
jgi:acetyl-CoA acetyltransferase